MTRLASIITLWVIAGVVAMPLANAGEASAPLRTISVSATGSVDVVPDQAIINTGVVSEAESARGALSANTKAMAKVVDGLKAAGIAAKDIQTSALQLNPRYAPGRGDSAPSITGYTATNQVRVTLRDVARAGEILDALVTLGANRMNGISFDVKDAEKLRDDARKDAMANARRRAELYAAAAGVTLGPVVTISESIESADLFGRHREAFSGVARAAAVPIEAGTQRLDATVYVTFELK